MSVSQKIINETKALAAAALYFGMWIGMLMVLKTLVLDEYQIAFHGWSLVFVGTFVLAKVVLVLEHVSLGAWIQAQPVWVDVLVRTLLYALGVFVVLMIEKAFEGRTEHGGFGPSLMSVFHKADMPHVWANTICLFGALLGYNILSVFNRYFGKKGMRRLFFSPLSEVTKRHEENVDWTSSADKNIK